MTDSRLAPQDAAAPQGWTAILLAGERPGVDPLADHFGAVSKALVPIGGRAMASRVLATLVSHPHIGRVLVLAQQPERLFAHADMAPFAHDPTVVPVVSTGGIARSIMDALGQQPPQWPILVTTADHVLLDADILSAFIDRSGVCDVAVGLVTRDVFVAEGMDTSRTWMPFRGAEVTGANLFALKSAGALAALDYWQKMEAHRKKPLSMAWRMGPRLLLAVLLRRLTVEQAVAALGRKLGIVANAVRIPHARAGVDVDKVRDHELVTRLLAADGVAV